MKPLIQLEDVSLGYGHRLIFEDLFLTIERGEFIAMVGENGAGKTTLIKGMLGLLRPRKGSIRFFGEGRIGYMPQQSIIQRDFPASAREIILSGNVRRGGFFHSKDDRLRTLQAAERLGVSSLLDEPIRNLSLGQKQRILLARALCAGDELLILDEPTSAMDERARIDFYQTLLGLHRDGVTILIISHHLLELEQVVQRVLHVENGHILKQNYKEYRDTLEKTVEGRE